MKNRLKNIYEVLLVSYGYKTSFMHFYFRFFHKRIIKRIKRKINYYLKNGDGLQNLFLRLPNGFNFKGINKKEIEDINDRANQILNGTYNVLGVNFPTINTDWHLDYKSGFKWLPGQYHKKYIQVDLNNNADVKIPREISRSHHIVQVALAYALTKNEKYAKYCYKQIEDWIAQNPMMYSINWGCAMDVSIRAVNWIWTLRLLSGYNQKNKNLFQIIINSLYEHGWYIYRNLEGNIFSYCNNHYLSDLVGLVYLGQLFPKDKEAEKWLSFGLKSFYREIRLEILPSGMTYERTTHYNRLVLELILWTVVCLRQNNFQIPQDIDSRLESMIEFVMNICRPDGSCPIIGDQDNGRFLPFGNENLNDFRYLMAIGSILYERSDFKKHSNGYNIYCTLLGIENSYSKFSKIKLSNEIYLKSIRFVDAGIYIMRHQNNFLIFNGATRGMYSDQKSAGVHTHSDLFSFDLYIDDKAFIIDPGTYTYTANKSERNLFRSTRMHNTVVVDKQNQDALDENKMFEIPKGTLSAINEWSSSETMDIISSEHTGYMRLKNPVKHKRTILFDKDKESWEITDELTGVEEHLFEVMFHFAPGINFEIINSETVETFSSGSNIKLSFVTESIITLSKVNSFVSISYGEKKQTTVLIVSLKQKCPVIIKTLFYKIKQ